MYTNCLAYRYGYRPKFFNGLPVFLEKAQTTGTNQNFIIRFRYFSCCCLFVSLWHCSHMSLSYLSSDYGSIFFCFSFCGALGLLLCLKSKKHKESDSLPSLIGNYRKSYLHAYLCKSLKFSEPLEVWTRGFIKDDVINGRLININSLYQQSVE